MATLSFGQPIYGVPSTYGQPLPPTSLGLEWTKTILLIGIALIFLIILAVILLRGGFRTSASTEVSTSTPSGYKKPASRRSGYPARLYPSNQTGRWTGLQSYVQSNYYAPHRPYRYLDVPNELSGVPMGWIPTTDTTMHYEMRA